VKIDYFEDPFVIVVKDMFTKSINQKILEEAISLKDLFMRGTTIHKSRQTIRTNQTAFYDNIYKDKREDSILLNSIGEIFEGKRFEGVRDVLSSSPFPLCILNVTTTHETQVSRYGDTGQKYEWHIDRTRNTRWISLVYHFYNEPKKFLGGDLRFSSSPLNKSKLLHDDYKSIKVENNTGYFFASNTSHCVENTTSPKKFEFGRFSVNCWIGMRE